MTIRLIRASGELQEGDGYQYHDDRGPFVIVHGARGPIVVDGDQWVRLPGDPDGAAVFEELRILAGSP